MPSNAEYLEACKRLVSLALETGDGQLLLDIKTVMDTKSEHQANATDPKKTAIPAARFP